MLPGKFTLSEKANVVEYHYPRHEVFAMKSELKSDLREFHAFVGEKLKNGGAELYPEAVLDEWRELHPDPMDFDEGDDVAAIQAAIDDLENGERGMPFEELDREFRKEFNIPDEPRDDGNTDPIIMKRSKE